MSLKSDQLQAIAKEVYQKFPELKGVRPDVQNQPVPSAKTPGEGERYLLTFKGVSVLAGTGRLVRVVRVTADGRGRVLKMSTSR
ncbi:MAG: hypothetical protein HY872_15515 [Chloroflexi bacterium]|nr:hypothetical protein [Chloroflexota bacterium]MBI5829582.1 hypothetical protein [Chloroflexota bacterium]